MIPTLQLGGLGLIAEPVATGGGGDAGVLDPFYPTTLYSLRKRRAAYTGACIRVRRSSDSTEQDIGFAADGYLDETALTAFVGGGNGFVAKWYDQSGGSVDLSHTGTPNLVRIVLAGVIIKLSGRAVIEFQNGGGLSVAANAAFAFGTAAWTWEMFDYHPNVGIGDARPLLDFRDGSSSTALFYNANANIPTYFDGANANSGVAVISSAVYYHQACSFTGGAGTVRLFTDGALSHSAAKSASFVGNRALSVALYFNASTSAHLLSNEIRITKGSAHYTAGFTAPDYYA